MSSRPTFRRNSNTSYRRIMLIIALVAALSAALMVFPAWWSGVFNPPNGSTGPGSNSNTQATVVSPSPIVGIGSPSPSPTPTPTPTLRVAQRAICGKWRSVSSQKNYNFICQGQGTFQIQEMNDRGQTNTGSGTIGPNGEISADLLIARNDRTAHLSLQLSSDGQWLVGTWNGVSKTEAGSISFQRIQ
jgi:hypothetical protein